MVLINKGVLANKGIFANIWVLANKGVLANEEVLTNKGVLGFEKGALIRKRSCRSRPYCQGGSKGGGWWAEPPRDSQIRLRLQRRGHGCSVEATGVRRTMEPAGSDVDLARTGKENNQSCSGLSFLF